MFKLWCIYFHAENHRTQKFPLHLVTEYKLGYKYWTILPAKKKSIIIDIVLRIDYKIVFILYATKSESKLYNHTHLSQV